MKNRLRVVVCILLAVASIAGAQQKVTIKFFHRWPQEPRYSYFNQVVADFEKKNPDIHVEMDSVINDAYKEKIRVLISSNNVPDVFVSWSDSFAYNLVKSGKVKPLNDMLAKDKAFADSFIQSQMKAFTFDGKVYGLPQTIDGKVFVYNKDAFAKAGITAEPKNYNELIADLQKLKNAGYNPPLTEGLMDAWAISHYLGTIFQRYLPAEVLDKDYNEATGEFTNPGYKVALERFQQLVNFMGPNASSINHTDARNLFIAGKVPVIYLQLAEFAYIQQGNPKFKWGYFNFPAFTDGKGDPTTLTGAPEGFMLSNTSKNPEAAERFIKFLLSKENAAKFVKDVGAPVAIKGAVNASNSYPELIEAVDLITKASSTTPWFDNAVNIKIADAFMRGMQAVAVNDKTIDDVLKDAQEAAKIVAAEAKKK